MVSVAWGAEVVTRGGGGAAGQVLQGLECRTGDGAGGVAERTVGGESHGIQRCRDRSDGREAKRRWRRCAAGQAATGRRDGDLRIEAALGASAAEQVLGIGLELVQGL